MMIYAKVLLKMDFELTIPMQGATSVEEINAQIEKEGGKDAFIEVMSAEAVKKMSTPFTTGRVTSGTVEVVEV